MDIYANFFHLSPLKNPPKQGCVLSESHQSGVTHYPAAANELWSSCVFIGPLSTDNQNCARYTSAEITQNRVA